MLQMLIPSTEEWQQAIELGELAVWAQHELAVCLQQNACALEARHSQAFTQMFMRLTDAAQTQNLGLAVLLCDPAYEAWKHVVSFYCRGMECFSGARLAVELTHDHLRAAEWFYSLVIRHICRIA